MGILLRSILHKRSFYFILLSQKLEFSPIIVVVDNKIADCEQQRVRLNA